MVKFYDLDCSRFRKPGFDFGSVEDKVLQALAEAMKNGQNPEQVLQQLLQQPEFREYTKELTQHYEQLRKEAEMHLKKDTAEKKREAAKMIKEEKSKAEEQAEQRKKELEDELKKVPKEFEEKKKEIEKELKKTEQDFKGTEKQYTQTLEQFLQNLDKTLEEGKTSEKQEELPKEKSKAYEAIDKFYQKEFQAESKEAKQAQKNKIMKNTLAKEAEKFAREKGKSLDEILENPLEQDELFQRLKQLYPKYCNLLQKSEKSLGQKIKEALSKAEQGISNAYESAKRGAEIAGRGCLTLAKYLLIVGLIGGAVGGIVYGVKKYRDSRVAAQESFEKELLAEDKGRIAWHDGSTIYVRAVQDLKTENTTKEYKPNASIGQILWSSDGKAVYYLENIGSWVDTVHQIVRYDLQSGNKYTILTLANYKNFNLDDDDIEYMQFNKMELAKSRIEFKLGNGKWHSINEDGTQLKLETVVSGTMQTSCPSGKHHLQITGKGNQLTIYHRDTRYNLEVGSSASQTIYTPVEEKIQVEKEK